MSRNVARCFTSRHPARDLVVNDTSRDRTEAVLKGLRHEIPTFRHINNSPPNGSGFAVRAGLVAFRGDAVALVMANASDSPDDLVAYHKKLQEGYECVFGSRFVSGARVVDYPWPKLILNRIANFLIPILFLDQIQRGDPTPSKRTGARLSPDCSRCSPITSI
jgi:dolichol-phosphate mannosyltransferase